MLIYQLMKIKIYKTVIFGLFASAITLFSCKNESSDLVFAIDSSQELKIDSSKSFKEPFRPQFHFTPEKKWMNDPNGMVYYKGIYHLFYQYYPDGIVWGPMHWGHATSTDLMHWKHKKIALFPDELGYIFSGSAVVDTDNTSGLGSKEHPAMIAIYTYHNMVMEKSGKINTQSQGLAYSLDEGESWTKYEGNPIIPNLSLKDFRDPKVFWNEDIKMWNMVLVAGDCAQFYTSKNLINWNFESSFGKNTGAHGGVWECPDVFKLKVENANEEKWVLFISVNPGAPQGGSGTQYFIGNFDGKKFTTSQKDNKWVDHGTDNYAGVTYNNAPENKRIFVGWMSNWLYAQKTPTKNWRSAMTLPRELALEKINENYVLKNKPVKQFNEILNQSFSKDLIKIPQNKKSIIEYARMNQSNIKFTANDKNLKLVFSNVVNDSLILKYNAKQKTFTIDRTHSGVVNFDENFAQKIHETTVPNLVSETIDFQIIMDWSSIEVFLNNGVYSFTEQIFPKKPYTKMVIQSDEKQEIRNIKIDEIQTIW